MLIMHCYFIIQKLYLGLFRQVLNQFHQQVIMFSECISKSCEVEIALIAQSL